MTLSQWILSLSTKLCQHVSMVCLLFCSWIYFSILIYFHVLFPLWSFVFFVLFLSFKIKFLFSPIYYFEMNASFMDLSFSLCNRHVCYYEFSFECSFASVL